MWCVCAIIVAQIDPSVVLLHVCIGVFNVLLLRSQHTHTHTHTQFSPHFHQGQIQWREGEGLMAYI